MQKSPNKASCFQEGREGEVETIYTISFNFSDARERTVINIHVSAINRPLHSFAIHTAYHTAGKTALNFVREARRVVQLQTLPRFPLAYKLAKPGILISCSLFFTPRRTCETGLVERESQNVLGGSM